MLQKGKWEESEAGPEIYACPFKKAIFQLKSQGWVDINKVKIEVKGLFLVDRKTC